MTDHITEKRFATEARDSSSLGDGADLEKTATGTTLTKTATGQAQIGADDDVKIDAKTFIACLALSFLWTGSQIPLYMLLACVDFTLADIGGAEIQVWYVLGPILALAATAPVAGSISDVFGRRGAVLAGAVSLCIGLILLGTAKIPGQQLASFPFTGIGAALLEINALAAVNEIAPNKLRGFYTSMLVWTIIPFAPLGIYALELSVHDTWRWNVWIPLIWSGIGLVLTWFFYRPPPRVFQGHTFTKMEKLKRLDWGGFFLSVAGITLFLFGLGAGGYTAPWKSATVIVPLILGFLLMVGLFFWEARFARNPLMDTRVFKNTRVFVLTLIITAVAGANFFSILILIPKYIFSVFPLISTAHQGLLIMAQTISTLFGAGFFSWTISRFHGSIRPQMMLACVLMIAGLGAIPAVGYGNKDTILLGFLICIGSIGVGGIVLPASVITQLCTPDEYLGTVTAITFVARVLGGAIGFACYFYILNSRATSIFADLKNPPSLRLISFLLGQKFTVPELTTFLQHLAISDLKYIHQNIPKATEAVITYSEAFARPIWIDAFSHVWYASIGFSAVGLIASVFLGDVRKYMTSHRAVVYH
ncbi:hypothetical protein PYCC9005_004962 [Savitreella phatthalungensis]